MGTETVVCLAVLASVVATFRFWRWCLDLVGKIEDIDSRLKSVEILREITDNKTKKLYGIVEKRLGGPL